ncbi:MAG: amidase [Acidimicrobiia bacterium]|nr:amidase [Acidimicrobiia bacterium]
MPRRRCATLFVVIALTFACRTPLPPPAVSGSAVRQVDRDLLDVTVERLHRFYDQKTYTVTQVVRWHLDRIDRYNGVYGAVETVFRDDAVALAVRLDADAFKGGTATSRGPLWGVPIVVKANTSVRGYVTTAGWSGFTRPSYELVAPEDATIVTKLRSAGAVILGHTNMPDLAASDTNRSSSFGRTGNAYDVRFSPGGSSGGSATAVAANFGVLGNGTDTGNSIRMPAATSALVGVFPTRGLVSIAGIVPLDWLLDNTGPIARTVTDAAVALSVMAGEDALDARTRDIPPAAQRPPYERYLKAATLKGRRFGVPPFILAGEGTYFHGIPSAVPPEVADRLRQAAHVSLNRDTRDMFMKAVEMLRATGADVVSDDAILPVEFARAATRIATYAYVRDGTDRFLARFGPPAYQSAEAYRKAVGVPLFASSIGSEGAFRRLGGLEIEQRSFDTDPAAERDYHAPRRAALAAYQEPLDRLKLDGYVYPAIQMPPPDETMPQDGRLSEGPHSATSWVNMLGVPAIVVPAGFYASGLPFGLEFSGHPWKDGDLLTIAYAWEQATRLRRPPVLVEQGLLPTTPARVR